VIIPPVYITFIILWENKISIVLLITLSGLQRQQKAISGEKRTHSGIGLWQATASADAKTELDFRSLLQFRCTSQHCSSRDPNEYFTKAHCAESDCMEGHDNMRQQGRSVVSRKISWQWREQQLSRITGLREELFAAEKLVESLRGMLEEAEEGLSKGLDQSSFHGKNQLPIPLHDLRVVPDLIEIFSDGE
jgi:hypothetical protein